MQPEKVPIPDPASGFDMRVRRIDVHDRAQWLIARRSGVTSSDAPRITGLAPEAWGTAYDVFAEKLGLVPQDDAPTEWQAWGTRMEPLIAAAYAERYPHRAVSSPAGALFRSRAHPHMLATPDRWLVDPDRGLGLLEAKNVTAWKAREWDGAEPPLYSQLQVMHQLDTLGLTWAVLAACVGGNRMVVFELDYDPEVAAVWRENALAFWSLVERRVPPRPRGQDLRLLAALYGTDGTSVDLMPDLVEVDVERQRLEDSLAVVRRQLGELEAQRDDLKATLLGAMGTHTYGVLPGTDVVLERRSIPVKGYTVDARTDVRLYRKGRHASDH
jgi:putative phage-type endonuclease